MQTSQTDQQATKQLLEGSKEIQRYLGISRWRVWNWTKDHGLPVCKLPNGRLGTTTDLLNAWILSRAENQRLARESSSKDGED